ncbi:MAG TPA: hypothetical protein VNJ01_06330 [Bacteriovoracaceae bacterium]|nr:hypothetical protein [Bacteriovoracaceae bacterium]
MKWIARPRSYGPKEQPTVEFLSGIITSQFNLITDLKIKQKIISILHQVPEHTMAEKMLKSYLYLMIGNITRSDNILRTFLRNPPLRNWKSTPESFSVYHRIARDHSEQIIKKLSRHPADRRTFGLFGMYLTNLYTDEVLLRHVAEYDTDVVESKLDLKYVEGLAPEFVRFLRLKSMDETRRIRALRKFHRYPWAMQSYWIWPFMEIDPLVSESLSGELQRLEKEDQLWFIYVMDNEKLADAFFKKSGKSFLPGRRQFLRTALKDREQFMLALFKLLEFGDIDAALTQETIDFLTHD